MSAYKMKHTVTFSDADEQGRIKLSTLVSYMMETSNRQLAQGNASVEAFIKRGIGWVVLDYHFEIERLPKANETVTFSADVAGYNRFFAYRDFNVTDEAGHEIITVHSQWVILDLKERKIKEADPKLMASFNNYELKKMPRFKRVRPLKDYEEKYDQKYQVRYYDLDTNHHMTNTKYFDWIVDSLPRDFLNNHQPKILDICFKKEIHYGQDAVSHVKLDTEKLTSKHEIVHGDDIATLAEITWL
ncbi:acyl-[acyl-carrier-protein] thioesterase [Lactobacillus sp. PV034]|uniref:acyl-[acyl-carrier-protein] thioesterase n=1 Tax=Lactobacillus sp. PV034 TaxID=2594495 RepID=UPI0022405DB2|nr:acyl-ACP thioesterase domain-containing protein [Lactobacillus sp. PV034]QNQ81438.1 acyl-[acyl-carrier-protein] thioesterase [Lactobacillus sp. PV034]